MMTSLKKWLFLAPLKFSALSICVVAAISIIYASVAQTPQPELPFFSLLFIGLIFTTHMLCRWLPWDSLSRRDYVATDNGLTLLYLIIMILTTAFATTNTNLLIIKLMQIQHTSVALFLTAILTLAFVYMYMAGVLISNAILTYRRARTMGISRTKTLLSFPFSFVLLWMPGYFMEDDKQNNIKIKSDWYLRFVNWILVKPVNAVVLMAVITVLMAMFADMSSAILTAGAFVIFCVWVYRVGAENFIKNIGGAFASFAVVLNIFAIVAFLSAGIFTTLKTTPNTTVETYEIAEVTDTQ